MKLYSSMMCACMVEEAVLCWELYVAVCVCVCVCMHTCVCVCVLHAWLKELYYGALVTQIIFILFCSLFLYECSHPNKYGMPQIDLSNDSETSVDLPSELPPYF